MTPDQPGDARRNIGIDTGHDGVRVYDRAGREIELSWRDALVVARTVFIAAPFHAWPDPDGWPGGLPTPAK